MEFIRQKLKKYPQYLHECHAKIYMYVTKSFKTWVKLSLELNFFEFRERHLNKRMLLGRLY